MYKFGEFLRLKHKLSSKPGRRPGIQDHFFLEPCKDSFLMRPEPPPGFSIWLYPALLFPRTIPFFDCFTLKSCSTPALAMDTLLRAIFHQKEKKNKGREQGRKKGWFLVLLQSDFTLS
jgi:hypothetical protein